MQITVLMTTVISNVGVTNKNTMLSTTVIFTEAERNTLAYYITVVMTTVAV
jgi:hypothetical protein